MGRLGTLFLAITSRLIFLGVGSATVYLLIKYSNSGDFPPDKDGTRSPKWQYVACGVPLLGIVIEIFMLMPCLCNRNRDFKYFWPAAFFYLCTLLPIFFIIQWSMYERRRWCGCCGVLDLNTGEWDKALNGDNCPSTMLCNATAPGVTVPVAAVLNDFPYNRKSCGGVGDDVDYEGITHPESAEYILKLMTGFVMFMTIMVARIVMPRDSLTRDQLATLLLGYIGNAADIIELFESLGSYKTSTAADITYLTAGLFGLASLQFCLFTVNYNTEGHISPEKAVEEKEWVDELPAIYQEQDPEKQEQKKKKKNKIDAEKRKKKMSVGYELMNDPLKKQDYISMVRKENQDKEGALVRGRGKKNLYARQKRVLVQEDAEEIERLRRKSIHGDVFQMLVTLLMQDAPFFAARLYILIKHNINTQMHIIFMTKNAIVCAILVYRLCVLTCKREDEEEELERAKASTKLRNVQIAMRVANTFNDTIRNKDHPLSYIAGEEKHTPSKRPKSALQALKPVMS